MLLTNRPKSFQSSSLVETSLSDFHKMAVTVMKTTFEKLKPRVTYTRNWNEFAILGHNKFLGICINTLDIFAPRLKIYLRGKKMPFKNKNVVNTHRKRACLRNKFLKNITENNKVCYSKQRDFCVNLLSKTKKRLLQKFKRKRCDNKRF